MKQRLLTGMRCKGNQLVLVWVLCSMALTVYLAERAFGTQEEIATDITQSTRHTYDQMGETAGS